jgi:hypothetical protein
MLSYSGKTQMAKTNTKEIAQLREQIEQSEPLEAAMYVRPTRLMKQTIKSLAVSLKVKDQKIVRAALERGLAEMVAQVEGQRSQ